MKPIRTVNVVRHSGTRMEPPDGDSNVEWSEPQ